MFPRRGRRCRSEIPQYPRTSQSFGPLEPTSLPKVWQAPTCSTLGPAAGEFLFRRFERQSARSAWSRRRTRSPRSICRSCLGIAPRARRRSMFGRLRSESKAALFSRFPPNLDLVCPGSCSALFLTFAHDHRSSFVGHVQIILPAWRARGTGFLELLYLVL